MDVMDIARFWSQVDVGHRTECWPWLGSAAESGHGFFKMDCKTHVSHRVAYRMAYGELDDGVVVRHSCDAPACCNPTHLLAGTHADNVRDRMIRNRSARGESSGRARLTESAVRHIRDSEMQARDLASLYRVSIYTVRAARQRVSWKHLP